MTVADLSFDQVTPDMDGLILPVTVTETGESRGSLRSRMVPVTRKTEGLRWQGFRLDGTTGPIYPTREGAAIDLLPGANRPTGAADAADSSMAQA